MTAAQYSIRSISVNRGVDGQMSKNSKKSDVVQVKNPKTNRYVKIDRAKGRIVSHKKSEGPYKNVPVARKHAKK